MYLNNNIDILKFLYVLCIKYTNTQRNTMPVSLLVCFFSEDNRNEFHDEIFSRFNLGSNWPNITLTLQLVHVVLTYSSE